MATCPNCRKHFRTPEDEDEQSFDCPRCGYSPHELEQELEEEPDEEDDENQNEDQEDSEEEVSELEEEEDEDDRRRSPR